MPTKEYSSWRSIPEEIVFISADFELDNVLADKVVALCKCDRDAAATVNIQRRYDGKYLISLFAIKSMLLIWNWFSCLLVAFVVLLALLV